MDIARRLRRPLQNLREIHAVSKCHATEDNKLLDEKLFGRIIDQIHGGYGFCDNCGIEVQLGRAQRYHISAG